MPRIQHPSGSRRGVSASATGGHIAHNRYESAQATLAIQARLEQVSRLWQVSVPASEIARQLHISAEQVRLDITTIRAQIAADRIASLHDRITGSVAKLLHVQQEAWQSYFALNKEGNAKDKDKAALLNIVLEAEDRINKLEGTDAPERVHAAAIAEVWQIMMDAAAAAGGASFQQYLLSVVQSRMGGSMSGQALGIGSPDPGPAESVVEDDGNEPSQEDYDAAGGDEDVAYTDDAVAEDDEGYRDE